MPLAAPPPMATVTVSASGDTSARPSATVTVFTPPFSETLPPGAESVTCVGSSSMTVTVAVVFDASRLSPGVAVGSDSAAV